MWPLDRASPRECVLVGRFAAERWACSGASMSLVARQPLPLDAWQKPDCAAAAVKGLYPGKPAGKVTLIVESAWLPLLLADTGGALGSKAQVEALIRHRLELLYGDSGEAVSDWELRVDHRAGRRFALGYGLSPRVKQGLVEAGRGIDLRWDALVPAFAWGWQRLRPSRRWPQRTGWWIWPEQDRLMAASVVSNQLVVLNAGAVRQSSEAADIERLVAIEEVRQGVIGSSDPISVGTWDHPEHLAHGSKRLTAVSITGPLRMAAAGAGVQQAAKVST